MKQKKFNFTQNFAQVCEYVSKQEGDEMLGRLIRCVYYYAFDGEMPPKNYLPISLIPAFAMAKAQIDNDEEIRLYWERKKLEEDGN